MLCASRWDSELRLSSDPGQHLPPTQLFPQRVDRQGAALTLLACGEGFRVPSSAPFPQHRIPLGDSSTLSSSSTDVLTARMGLTSAEVGRGAGGPLKPPALRPRGQHRQTLSAVGSN